MNRVDAPNKNGHLLSLLLLSSVFAIGLLLFMNQNAYSQTMGNETISSILKNFRLPSEKDVSGHYSNPQFGITDIVFPDGWHGTEIAGPFGLNVIMHAGNQSETLGTLFDKRPHPIQPQITFQVINNSDLARLNSLASKFSPEASSFSMSKNCNPLSQNSTSVIEGKTFHVMTVECPFSSLLKSRATALSSSESKFSSSNNSILSSLLKSINSNGVMQAKLYEYKTGDRTYRLALIVSNQLFSNSPTAEKPDIGKYLSVIDATANTLKLK
jgi:hypothetical protein